MNPSRYGIILISLIHFLVFTACKEKRNIVIPVPVAVATSDDIRPTTDSLIIPFQYSGRLLLDSLPIEERKEKFISLLMPSIARVKFDLKEDYKIYKNIIKHDSSKWSENDYLFMYSLYDKYKTRDTFELKSRLTAHPTSIVLAQAAIESAWGTSRFFAEACNPFGIWSFNEGEPRISSQSSRNGEYVYLRKYSSLEEAIDDYFRIIAIGPYAQLRNTRLKTRNPYKIIRGLENYSEKKETYIHKLALIIRKNQLEKYDHYSLNPRYIR
jgi:Bax protein